MDEAQFMMRIPRQLGEPDGVGQAELGAEPTEVVEELDGSGIVRFRAQHLTFAFTE